MSLSFIRMKGSKTTGQGVFTPFPCFFIDWMYKGIGGFSFGMILVAMLTTGGSPARKTRVPTDSVGFATTARQMDSVMNRIFTIQGQKILNSWKQNKVVKSTMWKTVICPHDDYCYAGWLYPVVLRNIKAATVILVGVAHKAKKFGLEDKIIFDDFDQWAEPYGPVSVSVLREKIMNRLPSSTYVVHDSMHAAEHSLEAIIPVLQYYNRNVEIVPILVPYMSFDKMTGLSSSLARALTQVMQDQSLEWRRDIAIVISTDAVHYGDEEWGGQDYAPYGCDSTGYRAALAHEHEIISGCLLGSLSTEKIRRFTQYTVQDTNYHTYKWTWCGRYSVPFGLLLSINLEQNLHTSPMRGLLLGYGNSIMQPPIPVQDLGMGKTAVADLHHWVGYAAIGYR